MGGRMPDNPRLVMILEDGSNVLNTGLSPDPGYPQAEVLKLFVEEEAVTWAVGDSLDDVLRRPGT